MTPEEAKHQLKAAKEAGTRPRVNPYPLGSEAAEQWQRGWETCLRGRQGPGFNPRNMNRYRVEGFKACLDSAPVDHMLMHQGRSEEWEEGYCQGFLEVAQPRQHGSRPSQRGKGRDWNFGYSNGRARGERIAQSRQSMMDYHGGGLDLAAGEYSAEVYGEPQPDGTIKYTVGNVWPVEPINCRSVICPTCDGGRNPPDTWGCSDCQNTGEMPDFETADQKEQAMDSQEAITLIQLTGGASIVKCVYLNSMQDAPMQGGPKGYHFKNVVGLDLAVDDIVVAETRDTYALVKVVEIDVLPDELSCSFTALKHLVQKVDFTALTDVHKQERKAKYKLGMSTVTSRLDKYREQLGKEGFGDLRGLLAPVNPITSAKFERKPGWTQERYDTLEAATADDTIEGSVVEDGGSDGFGEA